MEQKRLLLKAKKLIFSYNNQKYLPYKDSIFYFATYSNFIGSSILSSLSNKSLFKNIFTIIKDILYTLNYQNYLLIKPKQLNKKYDKIFLTWAFKNNFLKDGTLNDRYFNVNSSKISGTLWIVIYLDKKTPNKIASNILLFKPNIKKSYNIFKIIKILFNNLVHLRKGLKFYLCTVSSFNYFPKILMNSISPFFSSKIKHLVMPYEGQPFQNQIITYIKKRYKKIISLGYIHSPPLAIPANFIYKSDSPNKIILNGLDQKQCFTKILGWKNNRVKILPSFRFLKKNNTSKNEIFLPLTVQNPEKILNAIKFLIDNDYVNLQKYKVKNHPAAKYSKKNLKTMKLITLMKKNYKNQKNLKKKNYLIFIGNSGSIVEYLERGATVIQICDYPLFDIYTNSIWPSIISKKLSEGIYFYRLKKKGNLIKFGDKKNSVKKIFSI